MSYQEALNLLLYVHSDSYNIDELEIEVAKERVNEMMEKAIKWDEMEGAKNEDRK